MVVATSVALSLSLSSSLHLCAICEFSFYQRPRECWRAALMERQDWLCYSCVSPGEALAGVLAHTSGLTPAWRGVKNSPTQLLYTAPWGAWQSQFFPPTDVRSPETNGIGNKTSSPTLAAEVGRKILCLDGFKLSFVLLAGLQASSSLFMGSRQDSGHRRGFWASRGFQHTWKTWRQNLPQALLPAFFHLQQSCTLWHWSRWGSRGWKPQAGKGR